MRRFRNSGNQATLFTRQRSGGEKVEEEKKYIQLFKHEKGYLKFDTKLNQWTVGDQSSGARWYKVLFTRKEVGDELYDVFGEVSCLQS